MNIPIVQIDAFANRAFTGNPAAIMPLDAWLPDDVLQAIAEENNVSETAFLVPAEGDADFELRWFTPSTEVVLCGHATLASGHYILSDHPEMQAVQFRTRKAGVLTVSRDGKDYLLSLPAWKAEPKPLTKLVAGLGLDTAVETLWHPQRYGLIVVENAAIVRGVDPDFRALAADGDILTIVTAPGEETDVISRVFAPGGGIDEDPVTGSAHCLLTPYWVERLGRSSFTAFQASKRGGRVNCSLEGDRAVLGGACITTIEGVFRL